MVNFKKKTQKELILELLQMRGAISNFELRETREVGFQFPVRIHELQQEGHPIIGYHDEKDRRKYWYKYVRPQKDLFQP